MKFSYDWLKEYVSKMAPAKETAAALEMAGFEVEESRKEGADWLLDIKILPNRAHDCFAHLGIAREVAASQNKKFLAPQISLKEEKGLEIKDFLSVEVREPKVCPRYAARVVVDIKVGDSPAWLQERLRLCGLRPINNIVDITNYVMFECGQPLHAFDLDKLNAEETNKNTKKTEQKKIIVRKAQKGEKIITLDEGRAERILNENILVIADEKSAIGIAGIKGGKGPEIDAQTKRVALEAAKFDPINIRRSSKALNLRTDASLRFENDPDANMTVWALDRAAQLMIELAGGKAVRGVIDVSAKKETPWHVAVAHGYVEGLLGVKIKSEEIINIFGRLELPVKKLAKGKDIFYEVKVPTRRPDLLTSEDLIEEIGRLFGYQNIPAKMPEGSLLPALDNEKFLYGDEVSDILVGLGYSEVNNYSFISEADKNFYKFENLVEVKNFLSQDQKYLRPNLIIGFVKNLQENLKYLNSAGTGFSLKNLRLFEIGNVFIQTNKSLVESKKIGGLVFLKNAGSDDAFYELKGALGILFNRLGLAEVWDDELAVKGLPAEWKNILNPKRSAHLHVGDELVGWIGELGPAILDELKIERGPAVFEIDFDAMIRLVDEERIYQPPSKFPAIIRDLTILAPAETKIESLVYEIETAGGELLQDSDLFDIYEGENLEDEQKSVSFHLIFQSPEKSLSDKEVNLIVERIIKAIQDKGWEVRK